MRTSFLSLEGTASKGEGPGMWGARGGPGLLLHVCATAAHYRTFQRQATFTGESGIFSIWEFTQDGSSEPQKDKGGWVHMMRGRKTIFIISTAILLKFQTWLAFNFIHSSSSERNATLHAL
ncbi:hypothetical protein CC2G_012845 [Coprinopsis cinerea AmutBmut pab1-1]|nr:hypothetical protein CC2G_012845 [Coprinopsis cinerea AmutBmut pab1-1]